MSILLALVSWMSSIAFASGEANLLISVRSDSGEALAGAQIACGPRVMVADRDGLARFDGMESELGCIVRAPGRQVVALPPATLSAGENLRTVKLSLTPGSLKVVALDEAYQPINATVRFIGGPAPVDPVVLGDDGEQRVELVPGTWRLLVVDGRTTPVEAEVTVAPGGSGVVLAMFPVMSVVDAPSVGQDWTQTATMRLDLPEMTIIVDANGPRQLRLFAAEMVIVAD